jgi:hypothetical protein
VAEGALNQLSATEDAGEISVALTAQMPLPLIPAFLVPLFVMPHLTGPLESRRLTDALNN